MPYTVCRITYYYMRISLNIDRYITCAHPYMSFCMITLFLIISIKLNNISIYKQVSTTNIYSFNLASMAIIFGIIIARHQRQTLPKPSWRALQAGQDLCLAGAEIHEALPCNVTNFTSIPRDIQITPSLYKMNLRSKKE